VSIIVSELSSDWSREPSEKSTVTYRVDLGDRHYDVFIRSNGLQRQPGLDAALPLALLAAMKLRRPIRVKGALSATYLAGVRQVMALFEASFDEYFAVPIEADSMYQPAPQAGPRKAAFFSGGVDSFFTLIKGQEELTDILYIHGFDVRLDDLPRRAAVSAMGAAVAEGTGTRFIEVESNLGKVIQDFGSWPIHGHGFALMSVARALAGDIGEVRVPGTHSLQHQKPWGSWLDTDPLFSDERLAIVHDACEAERIDKIRRISSEPLAQAYLRVCWGKVDGMYNCCRCEKCLRTMVSLHALNRLEQFTSFPLPLETRDVARTLLPRDGLRIYLAENIELLRQNRPEERALIAALQRQLRRPIWLAVLRLKWRKRFARLKGHFRRLTRRGAGRDLE